MSEVRSIDGTAIAYEKVGEGPALILVDPALCSRSFGGTAKLAAALSERFTVYTYDRRGRGESGDTPPYAVEREVEDIEALLDVAGGSAYAYGISSGAVLALEAAKHLAGIEKLALYESPFIVDDTRMPLPDDFVARTENAIAAGRRGHAVKMFMRFVGMPAIFAALMPLTPMWRKLKAVAHTLPYDLSIMQHNQRGKPLSPGEFASVKVPTLVADGGKSPAWLRNASRALAQVLPNAEYRTLDGQTHMVKPKALAPALTEFFESAAVGEPVAG